jgi:hypothetical protein
MADFEPALALLTGFGNQQDVLERARQEYPELGDDPRSFGAHRLATREAAKRFGALPALGLGLVKEGVTGLASVAGGGSFVDPAGFDPGDIQANIEGAAEVSPFVAALLRGFRGR